MQSRIGSVISEAISSTPLNFGRWPIAQQAIWQPGPIQLLFDCLFPQRIIDPINVSRQFGQWPKALMTANIVDTMHIVPVMAVPLAQHPFDQTGWFQTNKNTSICEWVIKKRATPAAQQKVDEIPLNYLQKPFHVRTKCNVIPAWKCHPVDP